MMLACGLNAFRDARHPHNFLYYDAWDRAGVICWTQMGSRFWFDTPAFRENFLRLTAEWVRERRNSHSVLVWGIQNESALPETFAREVATLLRSLDTTSPVWRITTTCNGGKGSDWNALQDWSGTYGGN
jgi:beta-galactosidase